MKVHAMSLVTVMVKEQEIGMAGLSAVDVEHEADVSKAALSTKPRSHGSEIAFPLVSVCDTALSELTGMSSWGVMKK